MYSRSAEELIDEALKISPVVLISGARQVGKSTLCLDRNHEYRVFDNLSERLAATTDPIGYVQSLSRPVSLDEIQKAPQVLEGVKMVVDAKRTNGDFLLTGSANVLDMKLARDTLAGRLIEIRLFPLTQKEIHHKADENIIDLLFNQEISKLQSNKTEPGQILSAIVNGGYPEIQKINTPRGKSLWFNAYISTYVERDIRDVGELRDISAFIRFFNVLAPRSGQLLNKSNLASDSNLAEATVSNYLSMLEMIFQIHLLKPYSSNISKRFIKSPKLYMSDSGVFCNLLDIHSPEALQHSPHKGSVIETFVFNEIQRHIGYSVTRPQIYHYRTNDKKEIDFILQKGDKTFAIEVKASQSIKRDAFKHIIDLQKQSEDPVVGIVFYSGETILSFNDEGYQRVALPLNLFF